MSRKIIKEHRPELILLVLACFFFSGVTSLIYEVLWLRMLTRIIGGAPFAVSTILTIFMGGLGLGSYLAGRRIDRIERPFSLIRLYAGLEIAIGLYALAIPLLIAAFQPLFAIAYRSLSAYPAAYHGFTFIGCAVLLALPVLCMGATLPVLCRFYINQLQHLGGRAGLLYGINTIGGAAGAFLCGFFLLPALGIYPTLWIALGTNFAIGLVCLAAAARIETGGLPRAQRQTVQSSLTAQEEPRLNGHEKRQWQGALIILGISGCCAMAAEVFWTRLLGLLIGPTTYSFTIVLVTFILGLALGNIFFGRLADRSRDPFALLAATQMAAAFLVLGVSQVMGNSQLFFAKLLFTFQDNFFLQNALKGLCLFALMILPTFCFGAAFPLVGKIYTRTISRVGRSIGSAYAVNTLGAVTGAFCAGFILIPLVGKETGLALTAGIQLIAALAVYTAAAENPGKVRRRAAAAFCILAVTIALCANFPAWNRKLLALGKYHRFEEIEIKEVIQSTGWFQALFSGAEILAARDRGDLVYYGDGTGGFMTVLKYPLALGGYEYSLATSGKIDASSRGDMNTQTLLAHVPMLMHPEPKDVMVLGLASGITAGQVLHYPIRDLDVVEINRQAVAAARFFTDWNNNVLSNEKTDIIIQDGMAHLRFTDKKYDVIISEPSNPWMEGMAALFTKDFFTLAKNRLSTDGIYVQWFHCYQMDWPTLSLVGRTFASVFHDSMLINAQPSGGGRDFLMVGFKGDTGFNLDRVRQNIRFIRDAQNFKLPRPELLSRLIVSGDLDRLFGPGPINTAAKPVLEFAAPQTMYHQENGRAQIMKHIRQKAQVDPVIRETAELMKNSVDAQIDYAAFALSVYSPFASMVDIPRATPAQKSRFYDLMTSYCKSNPVDDSLFSDAALAEKCRNIQIKTLRRRMGKMPNKARSHAYLADLYLDTGRTDKAIDHYSKSLSYNPTDADIENNLGFLLHQKGKIKAAIAHYRRALDLRPRFARARGNLADAYADLQRPESALEELETMISHYPDMPEPRIRAALICNRQNNPGRAVSHLRRTVAHHPDRADALNLLAWILATTRDKDIKNPQQAVAYAQKACKRTNHQNASTLYTLSVAHAADRQFSRALEIAESALTAAKKAGREKTARMIEDHIHKLREKTAPS
ncbi:MAG: fused MFS/spermidine synthase [Desulfobacteraceae bacterium]|nr:fused MFS/spermidine synthase [Desulfobacteraceae bacterium]